MFSLITWSKGLVKNWDWGQRGEESDRIDADEGDGWGRQVTDEHCPLKSFIPLAIIGLKVVVVVTSAIDMFANI